MYHDTVPDVSPAPKTRERAGQTALPPRDPISAGTQRRLNSGGGCECLTSVALPNLPYSGCDRHESHGELFCIIPDDSDDCPNQYPEGMEIEGYKRRVCTPEEKQQQNPDRTDSPDINAIAKATAQISSATFDKSTNPNKTITIAIVDEFRADALTAGGYTALAFAADLASNSMCNSDTPLSDYDPTYITSEAIVADADRAVCGDKLTVQCLAYAYCPNTCGCMQERLDYRNGIVDQWCCNRSPGYTTVGVVFPDGIQSCPSPPPSPPSLPPPPAPPAPPPCTENPVVATVDFTTAQYASENSWHIATNEIIVFPEDGSVVSYASGASDTFVYLTRWNAQPGNR